MRRREVNLDSKDDEKQNSSGSKVTPDDQAVINIDLIEFQRLRSEIDNRTTISEAIVLGYVTALGGGLSLLEKAPDVSLALSFLSSLLWLSWLAHTYSISKLAGYIACELAPRIRQHSHSKELLLGWEQYSRTMNRAGVEAYQSPYPPPLPSTQARAPVNSAGCILGLFAGATPVLIFVYVAIAVEKGLIVISHTCVLLDLSNPISDARVLMMIISVVVWGVAIRQYCLVREKWRAIDQAVIKKTRLDNAMPGSETRIHQ